MKVFVLYRNVPGRLLIQLHASCSWHCLSGLKGFDLLENNSPGRILKWKYIVQLSKCLYFSVRMYIHTWWKQVSMAFCSSNYYKIKVLTLPFHCCNFSSLWTPNVSFNVLVSVISVFGAEGSLNDWKGVIFYP